MDIIAFRAEFARNIQEAHLIARHLQDLELISRSAIAASRTQIEETRLLLKGLD